VRATLALICLCFAQISAAQPVEVDVKIVISVDASGSVDPTEFRLQIDGITNALRAPAVQRAVRAGPKGRVLAAVLIWSDAAYPKYPTAWFELGPDGTFEGFATEIEKFKISAPGVPAIGGGGTNIGDGLIYAINMLEENTVPASRLVIDVSGDGPESKPWVKGAVELPQARALAAAKGITVNGLAIEADIAGLHLWYEANLITGAGSFVEQAADFQDYRRAILKKLLRELSGQPFTRNGPLRRQQMGQHIGDGRAQQEPAKG